MTTCRAGCGQCCEVLGLAFSQFDVRVNRVQPGEVERRFILEKLTPINAREARRRAPWMFDDPHGRTGWHPRLGMVPVLFYFTCANYDPETRSCTDHENRPDMCRLFPEGTPDWPREDVNLPPACSFNADLGRPVAPLPVESIPVRR